MKNSKLLRELSETLKDMGLFDEVFELIGEIHAEDSDRLERQFKQIVEDFENNEN